MFLLRAVVNILVRNASPRGPMHEPRPLTLMFDYHPSDIRHP